MIKQTGINVMKDEGYNLPIENEQKLQKTDFAWWSSPVFIIFLTVSMSVLDALVLYDILDTAMTQAEYMGKVVSFGIALILNMMPLLIAKFMHQSLYRIKKCAAVWVVTLTVAFFLLFGSTVVLRFAYQDQYGDSNTIHITNEVQADNEMIGGTDTDEDPKGFAVVLLLSIEPLVTSMLNFFLAFISDDELREKINRLRVRRLELTECETDLKAFLSTTEPVEQRREQLLLLDSDRKKAAKAEIQAHCNILRAFARSYLAEYLQDPVGASYVTASLKKEGDSSQEQNAPVMDTISEKVAGNNLAA